MRTTATSLTLPLVATIGGDGTSAQARVTATTTETGDVYELDLALEQDGAGAGPLPPAPIGEVVAFIRALDPRRLADAADRASTSMADDPTGLVRDLIASMVDQQFTEPGSEPAP